MSNYAISLKRTGLLLAALTFTALLMVVNLASFFGKASAAQLTSRSLTLSSTLPGSATDGDPGDETNGSAATHTFQFTTGASGGTAVAVRLEYCTTALGACTPVPGLDVEGAAVDDPNTTPAGLTVDDDSTDNILDLDSGTFANNTATTITITDIQNPDIIEGFYVRITTYSDAFTTVVDEGTVASAITEGIDITARVAETLGFSTTGSFAGVGDPGNTCAALTGSGAITLGDPDNENTLSLTQAYDNYSAFRLYTNAASGVVVQYEGDTLRHSNTTDSINPMAAAAVSNVGVEQFGLAVDDTVGTSADVDSESRLNMVMTYVDNAAGFAADGTLTIAPDYANGDGTIVDSGTAQFKFVTDPVPADRDPDTIASTAGYTECKTVPVRYMANISPTTTSGTYTTTIVYSAVPTY